MPGPGALGYRDVVSVIGPQDSEGLSPAGGVTGAQCAAARPALLAVR